jgi:hypothetical protein
MLRPTAHISDIGLPKHMWISQSTEPSIWFHMRAIAPISANCSDVYASLGSFVRRPGIDSFGCRLIIRGVLLAGGLVGFAMSTIQDVRYKKNKVIIDACASYQMSKRRIAGARRARRRETLWLPPSRLALLARQRRAWWAGAYGLAPSIRQAWRRVVVTARFTAGGSTSNLSPAQREVTGRGLLIGPTTHSRQRSCLLE